MNELQKLNNDETIRISSREVAGMLTSRHDSLIRKIEGITKDFREHKIVVSEYWVESTYKIEGNNKSYKEYLLSKKGCEFLAHKTTGKKGNLFTHKYMKRFEEMEEKLKSQAPQISERERLLLQLFSKDSVEVAQAHKQLVELEVKEATTPLLETIEESKPKVEYHDEVLNSNKLVSVTNIAKDLGMSAVKLNQRLHEKGVIWRPKYSKTWYLYKEYQHMIPEYCDYHITKYSETLKWTEKGRKWIIDLLEDIE